jgi:hypothetical protein
MLYWINPPLFLTGYHLRTFFKIREHAIGSFLKIADARHGFFEKSHNHLKFHDEEKFCQSIVHPVSG